MVQCAPNVGSCASVPGQGTRSHMLQLRVCILQQMILCVCVFSHLVVSNAGTLWTVAHQSPLFMEFPRQEYWSVLPFPTPEDLPDPGIKLGSLASPALVGGFFTTRATWEVQ